MVPPLWKTFESFLTTFSLHPPPHDPVIPFLGIYPREMETYVHQKKSPARIFIAASFIVAKPWKQSRFLSTEEGTDTLLPAWCRPCLLANGPEPLGATGGSRGFELIGIIPELIGKHPPRGSPQSATSRGWKTRIPQASCWKATVSRAIPAPVFLPLKRQISEVGCYPSCSPLYLQCQERCLAHT